MHSLFVARTTVLRRTIGSVRAVALNGVPHAPLSSPTQALRPTVLITAVNPFSLAQQERSYASRDGARKPAGGQFKKKRKPAATLVIRPETTPPWLAIPDDAEGPVVTVNESTSTIKVENDEKEANVSIIEPCPQETIDLLLTSPPNVAWFHYTDLPLATREQLSTYTINKFLACLKRGRGTDTLQHMQQVINEAEKNGNVDTSTYNTLLHAIVRDGKMIEAQQLLSHMNSCAIKRNTVTYNILLYGYTRANMNREAKNCFEQLRAQEDDVYPDSYSFTTMIAALCRRGLIAEAEDLVMEMQTSGFPMNTHLEEIMLRGYALANRIKTALSVLKVLEARAIKETAAAKNGELPEGTKPYQLSPGLYNAIIGAQWRAKPDSHRVMEIYNRMRSHGVRPNPMTYAITELTPDAGFSMMRSHKWEPTTQEMNIFLNDALKKNDFTGAFNIIREAAKAPAISLDATSYAILIDAQVKAGQIDDAFDLFKDMREDGIAPDTVVYTTLLDACARINDIDRANALFNGMLDADVTVRPNIYSYNVMLGMLARKGDLKRAHELMDSMPEHGVIADVRSYNTLLTLYATKKDTNGAWQLYETMNKQGIIPDVQTFGTLMDLSVNKTDLAFGERVFNAALVYPTIRGERILAPMAAQLMQLSIEANQAARAQAIWQQLSEQHIQPNQHCIATILQACMQQGHLETAHTIWNQLAEDGVEIRDRALNAYATILLVEERWDEMLKVFKSMQNTPSDETLVPFLDKLREAGRIEEANELLRSARQTPSKDDRTFDDSNHESKAYSRHSNYSDRYDNDNNNRRNYRQNHR
ncbi:hypothetical protein BDF19DRAFT_415894 [Syncephalis fuscata]|nr:hypothetical protein BDF19DRAFT_415894 [Syncephalis fuscata]